jgi:D-arabinan exo alpha-(1,3)/(1,5)-arabinofuranosidase (non-reducing end)
MIVVRKDIAMKTSSVFFFGAALIVGFIARTARADEATITLQSLLRELIDYDQVARWPEPAYTCKQASSYDRASKTPDDPKTWFANGDQNQFIREEKVGGHVEKVMMDATGPGAIVRFWITCGDEKEGKIRIYFDGADTPTVIVPSFDFTNNDAIPAGKPLLTSHPGASPKGRGGNTLFLPIPYAKHCKVTWEEGETKRAFSRYYQINYRTYPAATKVETYSPAVMDAAKGLVESVNRTLTDPAALANGAGEQSFRMGVKGTGDLTFELPLGPSAVRELEFDLSTTDAQTLRSRVLRGEFDDEETIWCPVSEFFGSGVGANDLHNWYRTVTTDGKTTSMICRWVMPYRTKGKFTLVNLSNRAIPLEVKFTSKCSPWQWDARSMHFHANWRQQYPIATRPFSDWNYISVNGQGVYVGDNLCVMQPAPAWWGEGDEKVWVDDDSFPSHFGTGSEDYYCYSWGDTRLFQTPFANQTRCDGPGSKGQTCLTRTRSLDAIPFTKSLRFDMEVWNWAANVNVCYAATTYWYGRPGAVSNRGPEPKEAARPIPTVPPPQRIAGAIECETMKIVAKSPNTPAELQSGALSEGEWSNGAQLWVRGNKPGDFVELAIPGPDAGAKKLTLYATKSWDYGILRFSVNGQRAGKDFDSYSPSVILSGPIALGTFEPKDGRFLLRVEVVGGNPESKNSKSYFGLDAVSLGAP